MLPNGVVNKPNDGVAFDFAEYVSTKKSIPKNESSVNVPSDSLISWHMIQKGTFHSRGTVDRSKRAPRIIRKQSFPFMGGCHRSHIPHFLPGRLACWPEGPFSDQLDTSPHLQAVLVA